jgi:hypothetical protein
MVLIFQHSLFGDILIRKRTDRDQFIQDEGGGYEDEEVEYTSFKAIPGHKGGDEAANSIQSFDDDLDDEIIELDDDEDGNTEDTDDIL